MSVIITTYNRPDALMMVLEALAKQTDQQFEVIIADDGSSLDTCNTVKNLKYPFNLQYIWQEDDGFQAAKIRNKAAAASKGNYLIFLDGDCVPTTTFIENHRHLAREKYCVAGNRILLTKNFTDQVLSEKIPVYHWTLLQWILAASRNHCNRWIPFLKLPTRFLKHFSSKKWRGVKTCNLAIWRADFLAVNGFNEQYVGWGYEDSDIVIRLIRSGIRVVRGRFSLPVIHLWHPESDRQNLNENNDRLEAIQKNHEIRVELGVTQYLKQLEDFECMK